MLCHEVGVPDAVVDVVALLGWDSHKIWLRRTCAILERKVKPQGCFLVLNVGSGGLR